MACLVAGMLGCGRGPAILFFQSRCFEAAGLEEGIGDPGHQAVFVDFHWELTRAARVFPPRTDPCSNLAPLALAGGIGVIDMELLSVIRRWHYRDHFSIREISRRTGLSRNTVRKYLRSDSVEPKFAVPDRPSRLDPYADKLSHMLRQEAGKSRKQKRTVKQLHADLVALGYDGSYNRVAAFARDWKAARQREQQTTGRGVTVRLRRPTRRRPISPCACSRVR